MRIASISEAQHHLSKLLMEVANGREIVLTRRGKEVGELVPIQQHEESGDRIVDWAAWALKRRAILATTPRIEGSAVDLDREDYRW